VNKFVVVCVFGVVFCIVSLMNDDSDHLISLCTTILINIEMTVYLKDPPTEEK